MIAVAGVVEKDDRPNNDFNVIPEGLSSVCVDDTAKIVSNESPSTRTKVAEEKDDELNHSYRDRNSAAAARGSAGRGPDDQQRCPSELTQQPDVELRHQSISDSATSADTSAKLL